jgi:hypothetical protein
MNLLKYFFGRVNKPDQPQPSIVFGRFTDLYKQHESYRAWEQALQLFSDKKHFESVQFFLEYLRNGDGENVTVFAQKETLKFSFVQGSKLINGYCTPLIFKAGVKIVRVKELKVAFMRRLLEQNFELEYCRFCLDNDGDVSLIYDSFVQDASPYKLFRALKELALYSDRQDDLLDDEFEELIRAEDSHLNVLSKSEVNEKISFIRKQIDQVFYELENGRTTVARHTGGAAYLLLDTAYKLDYLTRPEGFVQSCLENVHTFFYGTTGLNLDQKLLFMKAELEKIVLRSDEQIAKEFYASRYTFGVTIPSSHEKLTELINAELNNADWYIKNKHELTSRAVPGFIVGHALFNYALPEPDMDLLNLYYQINEQDYFNKLGYLISFVNPDGSINKSLVKARIRNIERTYRDRYEKWTFPFEKLNFDNVVVFSISMLECLSLVTIKRKTN